MNEHQEAERTPSVLRLTGQIATAYLANNELRWPRVGELLTTIRTTLESLDGGDAGPAPVMPTRAAFPPAVDPKRSVFPNQLLCLECGAKYKTIRRHLNSAHGLTPEAYRQRWGLSVSYPMVAPEYTKTRSRLAKETGLGHRVREAKPNAALKAAAGRYKARVK